MSFRKFYRLVLSCGVIAPTMAAALQSPEVVFQVDAFGLNAATLSVQGPPTLLSGALSDDNAIFTLHMAEGVFIDRSAVSRPANSVVRAVNQLRGPMGVDLVVSLREGAAVTGRRTAGGVRYVFAAKPLQGAAPQGAKVATGAEKDCAAERGKITELQALVRELTLKLVELEKKLQGAGAAGLSE